MLRAGKLASLAIGLACLITGFTLLAPGAATAATTPGGRPIGFAAMTTPPKTVTSQYSCDLSAYGSSTPVTLNATLAVPTTAQADAPLEITLKTTSATLPPSVLSQLPGVVSFDLTAAVTAQQASSASVPLSGTNPVSGTLTGLPAANATGTVTFPSTGTTSGIGVIKAPAPMLTFTPHTGTTALKAITCTTTAAKQDIQVTVIVGTSGPLYKFTVFNGRATTTFFARFPMTITSSGTRTTGKTDTVTLVVGFGGFPSGASVSFSGDLPVRGAQPGKIALAKTTTDATGATFTVSGKLRLTKSGTDQILVPEHFTFTVNQSGFLPIVFTFAIKTSPTPVGLTFKVTKGHVQPHPHPTGSPTSASTAPGGGGSGQGSGTPVGAPATGGGSGPAGDLGAAAAGLAILLSGGGLVFFARRRRGQGAA
jgi:hypothetical protein